MNGSKDGEQNDGEEEEELGDEAHPEPEVPASPQQLTHKRKPSKAINGATEATPSASSGMEGLQIGADEPESGSKPGEEQDNASSATIVAGATAEETNGNTEAKLDAMARERSALRDEVSQLRKSLEELQGKHDEEVASLRQELEETQGQKENADTQYRNLLGRVNTIKSQLGERLKADAVRSSISKPRGGN